MSRCEKLQAQGLTIPQACKRLDHPYPFVDVSEHGYGRVFLNGVGLLVFFAVAGSVLVLVGNLLAANVPSARRAREER